MSLPEKIFGFLSSLKLAVIVLVSLAVSLAAATFVESAYDTPTARHYFYQAPWFTGILVMLAINVLCAALSRWPWQPRHYGFVVTHAGIIVLLIGAMVTQKLGCEGQLMLDTGEQSADFLLNQQVMTVYSQKADKTAEFPVDLRFRDPSIARPVRLHMPDGGPEVDVIGFMPATMRQTAFQAGQPSDPPAVHFSIANARVQQDQWLGGTTDDTRQAQLGLASFELVAATNAASLKALLAPQQGKVYHGELVLNFPGSDPTFEVAGNIGKVIDIPNTDYKLNITRFLPNAAVAPDKKHLISKGDDPINPALEFEIITHKGVEEHTVLAKYPDVAGVKHDQHSGLKPQFEFDPDQAQQDSIGNKLRFVAAPDGKLYANLHARDGRNQVTELKPDTPFDTGWMGLQVEVQEFLPHAASADHVVQAEVPRGQEGDPGAHLLVQLNGQNNDFWIREGEAFTLDIGGDHVEINYRRKSRPMGFALRLDKFKVDHDPGTNNAAAYTSNVTMNDPTAGIVNQSDIICMNTPLHHNGWTVFQSSFQEIDGVPRISIFTVAYDPGVPIKYAGSLIMCLGIALMFWLRGWYQGLGRKQRPARKDIE